MVRIVGPSMVATALAVVLAGCGGGGAGPGDVDSGMDGSSSADGSPMDGNAGPDGNAAPDGQAPEAGPGPDGGSTPDAQAPMDAGAMLDGGAMTDAALDGSGPDFSSLPAALADGSPANYDCLGSVVAPSGGDPVDFTIAFGDLGGTDTVGEICFSMYADNTAPMTDDCATSGQTATVSNSNPALSTASVSGPDGGWFAYRIYPNAKNIGVLSHNRAVPDQGGRVTVDAMSPTTANLITGIYGLTRDPADAMLAGRAIDCDGTPVEGVAFRVVRDGKIIGEGPGAQDAHYEYYDGAGFPEPGRAHTNADGLYFASNIPVTTEGEAVEMVACANVGGTPTLVGCEHTRIFVNHITIIDLTPVRADVPACTDVCSR